MLASPLCSQLTKMVPSKGSGVSSGSGEALGAGAAVTVGVGSGEAETSASRVPQPASAVKSPSAISNAAACLFKRNTSNVSAL